MVPQSCAQAYADTEYIYHGRTVMVYISSADLHAGQNLPFFIFGISKSSSVISADNLFTLLLRSNRLKTSATIGPRCSTSPLIASYASKNQLWANLNPDCLRFLSLGNVRPSRMLRWGEHLWLHPRPSCKEWYIKSVNHELIRVRIRNFYIYIH